LLLSVLLALGHVILLVPRLGCKAI
jgi:hypothetical protein